MRAEKALGLGFALLLDRAGSRKHPRRVVEFKGSELADDRQLVTHTSFDKKMASAAFMFRGACCKCSSDSTSMVPSEMTHGAQVPAQKSERT